MLRGCNRLVSFVQRQCPPPVAADPADVPSLRELLGPARSRLEAPSPAASPPGERDLGLARGLARAGLRAGPFVAAEAQLLHLPGELCPLDPEVAGRLPEVPPVRGEPLQDVLPLEARARLAQGQGAAVRGCAGPRHLERLHDVPVR